MVNESAIGTVGNVRSLQPGFITEITRLVEDQGNNYSVEFSAGRNGFVTYSAFQGNETNTNYMSDPFSSAFSDYNIYVQYTGDNTVYWGTGSATSSTDSPSGSVYAGIGISNFNPPSADYEFTVHSALVSSEISTMPTFTIGTGNTHLH